MALQTLTQNFELGNIGNVNVTQSLADAEVPPEIDAALKRLNKLRKDLEDLISEDTKFISSDRPEFWECAIVSEGNPGPNWICGTPLFERQI